MPRSAVHTRTRPTLRSWRLIAEARASFTLCLLAMLVASALVAAGCGGGVTKTGYIARADRIGADVDAALQLLQPRSGNEPTADDLHAASRRLAQAAHKLDNVTPPAEVADAHRHMVAGLREMSDAFEHLASDFGAAKTDEERTTAFLKWTRDARAQRAFDDLSTARRAFKKSGYDLFPATTSATTNTAPAG